MATYPSCQFSRGVIDAAGKKLLTLAQNDPERDGVLDVINNWRSCHSYPLHIVTKNLSDRAKNKVNPNALVARRIKRLSSIALKLRHNAAMQLSQMQDIGGCRAVLNSVGEAEDLVDVYYKAIAKHPNATDRPNIIKKFDYIQQPKADGYRGIHLIVRYQSKHKSTKLWSGQKIEIQIRSKVQHAWATAVETCQTFTGQALKSKIKSASDTWLRFFSLMSTAIAAREKRPIVPGTPQLGADHKQELRHLESQEKIIALLTGWGTAMQHPDIADDHASVAFLLELNVRDRRLRMHAFKENEMLSAHEQYLSREKATENDSSVQVVLVSADSVANLRRAYPNFYVDTTEFIAAIQQEIY